MKTILRVLLLVSFLIPTGYSFAQGKVYIVLGSDTGIWDGLNVDTYHDHYGFDLYTDPKMNGYKVMDPAFRNQLTDSYGQTVRLIWWIMGGNTFRYATNNDVPIDNTMVLHLMLKYHGDAIAKWGDEVTLHYHDWIWSDFNGDGKYYWNQSTKFSEFKEDFVLVLAQYLLEENVYPVSFRSGWHYMNNDWQNYINTLIPFSLHDDYPNVRADTVEPLDNIYDWSKSSSEFVPFHPSTANYQLPGDGKGWDNRSIYMASMDTTLMAHVFSQAQKGIDQVVCMWAHLPENNYLDNVTRINQILHQTAAKFPDVKFRYCTAVEAMQRWMKAAGLPKPEINFQYEQNGGKIDFVITTNKPIFQAAPFLAVKDMSGNYSIVHCHSTGTNAWKSDESFDINSLAKAGVAVTDTVGNLSTAFVKFVPDDIYMDNTDSGYTETKGTWSTSSNAAWGMDSRQASLGTNDTAVVSWTPAVGQSRYYSLFAQVPKVTSPVSHTTFRIYSTGREIDSVSFDAPLPDNEWIYLGTERLDSGSVNRVEMAAYTGSGTGGTVAADVIKITPLITDRRLSVPQSPIDFGMVSQDDSTSYDLELQNSGVKPLTVSGITSPGYRITTTTVFPVSVPPMGSVTVPLVLHPAETGKVQDTIYVYSNDSLNSVYAVPFMTVVRSYFKVVDNSDSSSYTEAGAWAFSNAAGFEGTSRYAYLNQSPPASATYGATLNRGGIYDIMQTVPTTVNACKRALYIMSVDNVPVDSIYVDQNAGSGGWVTIGRSYLPAGVPIELKIMDSGENTSNVVLRADAIQFSLVKEVTKAGGPLDTQLPKEFRLEQNFPNPFNPTTVISYRLSAVSQVTLKIFDVLGREVAALVNGRQNAGIYTVNFDASRLSSGVYFYRIVAGDHVATRKMLVMK